MRWLVTESSALARRARRAKLGDDLSLRSKFREPVSIRAGSTIARQPRGLYAITSISTFASTIRRASVVERAGLLPLNCSR
jgi:hypothetical protein